MTSSSSVSAQALAKQLNQEYQQIHAAKEDAFWRSYMGLDSNADVSREKMTETEIAWKNWLSDTERLGQVQSQLDSLPDGIDEETKVILTGWAKTLSANSISTAEARDLSSRMIEQEGRLGVARGKMQTGYQVEGGDFIPASSIELAGMLRTDSDEKKRKAAFNGLRAIENHVLNHGFIEMVKLRNQFARALGASDFYAWKSQVTEGMSKEEIFELLNALESKTRESGEQAVKTLTQRQDGGGSLRPWNAQYTISGNLAHQLNPFFPFEKSFLRWGQCFSQMGVKYRDATLVLDLLDRKGKYENGFMHGPRPAWHENGQHHPATIHFTTNAIPKQVGAGQRSLETFLHEGGHAAHFANIDMPSPCFAQEFAPTSIAFSEIQSMFFDNLMHDVDWLVRYAKTIENEPIPFELIEKWITDVQPFSAWQCRLMLVVPFFEKELYELPENELTPDNLLKIARRVESQLTFIPEGSSRPLLSVPHLLSTESSAYYHGYVLAQMGVDQTRNSLLDEFGTLTDNPQVGPKLAECYWQPGNSLSTQEFLNRMTHRNLSENDLADRLNRSVDVALSKARSTFDESTNNAGDNPAVSLDATISIADGNDIITSTSNQSFEQASVEFERWIASKR